jgi:hypothetical protein
MNIENAQDANVIFELLGIKDVTTKRQEENGTIVYELPFKRCSINGTTGKIKFACYKSGYIRDVSDWNSSCWQINRTKKVTTKEHNYKYESKKRILIHGPEARIVYLANYVLKNYYRNPSKYLVGEWTRKQVVNQGVEITSLRYQEAQDVKVIINGHRYNLS